MIKFWEQKIRKHRVVSRLFEFWRIRVPVTSVSGFIDRVFPESGEDLILRFRRHCSKTALEDLE